MNNVCKNCTGTKWIYAVTYVTEILANAKREQVKEEIRCRRCGHKATVENNNAIRASKEFRDIRSKENTKL